ncbi:unnamed protein product [Victoria cruziana]
MEAEKDESFRKKGERFKRPQGEEALKSFAQEVDFRLDTTRARLSNVLKKHEQLSDRLTRDSDKVTSDRLRKEFDDALNAQTEELHLDGEQWNDGLLATIRERVHMEADRKNMPGQSILNQRLQGKTTYKVGNKVICCLERARIGIQYQTSFAGETCEFYYCVLESRSFLEKMAISEHTVPFFIPIQEAEADYLSSNAMKFIDYVGDCLQGYIDRREQVRLLKELYRNQIGELYHSLSYNLIEFVIDDFDCKVTVSLRYGDLVSVLPTRAKVLAWPVHCSKQVILSGGRRAEGPGVTQLIPTHLAFAEEAFRTLGLAEAYAEIILNLKPALRQLFPSHGTVVS